MCASLDLSKIFNAQNLSSFPQGSKTAEVLERCGWIETGYRYMSVDNQPPRLRTGFMEEK